MVLSLSGVIDASTIPMLESMLDQDSRREKPLALLRLGGVSYINSSGMGLFIKYSDRYRSAGGELCFSEVSTKVLALFRMMGLLSVLRVFSSEAQAVEGLKAASGAAVPAAAPPSASVVAAPSAQAPTTVSFPYRFSCSGCRMALVIPESGYYKCPVCAACYLAEAGRALKVFLAERRLPFEAALTYDERYLDGVCAILERIAEGAGLASGERERLSKGVRHLIGNLIQRANGSAQGKSLKLLVASDPGECLVGIRSDVKLPSGERDPALDLLREGADTFQLIDAGGGGSFFKIRKKAALPPKTPQSP